jgi:hypothetical protein
MFMKSKRPEKEDCGLPKFLNPPPPPFKKEFSIMKEILKDAVKYDDAGEKEVSNQILTNLCEFIERYKAGSRS